MDTDNPLGRVELSLTMPIYHGYRFSIGGSVKPARMQAESGWAGTVRFERKIAESLPLQGRAQRPVIAYAGLRIANREPTTIDIGIYTTF
jgi:hypothetical protein